MKFVRKKTHFPDKTDENDILSVKWADFRIKQVKMKICPEKGRISGQKDVEVRQQADIGGWTQGMRRIAFRMGGGVL